MKLSRSSLSLLRAHTHTQLVHFHIFCIILGRLRAATPHHVLWRPDPQYGDNGCDHHTDLVLCWKIRWRYGSCLSFLYEDRTSLSDTTPNYIYIVVRRRQKICFVKLFLILEGQNGTKDFTPVSPLVQLPAMTWQTCFPFHQPWSNHKIRQQHGCTVYTIERIFLFIF